MLKILSLLILRFRGGAGQERVAGFAGSGICTQFFLQTVVLKVLRCGAAADFINDAETAGSKRLVFFIMTDAPFGNRRSLHHCRLAD